MTNQSEEGCAKKSMFVLIPRHDHRLREPHVVVVHCRFATFLLANRKSLVLLSVQPAMQMSLRQSRRRLARPD